MFPSGLVLDNLFTSSRIFELTGAHTIKNIFAVGEEFKLEFSGRGTIYGYYLYISKNKIELKWQVKGFNRPDEQDSKVSFSLQTDTSSDILTIFHESIPSAASAAAKEQAWNEILNLL